MALLGCNPAKTTDGTDTEPGNLDSADAGWGGFTGSVALDPSVQPPDRLSEIQLIAWVDDTFLFNEGVVPYSLINGQFSDYASRLEHCGYLQVPASRGKILDPLNFQ